MKNIRFAIVIVFVILTTGCSIIHRTVDPEGFSEKKRVNSEKKRVKCLNSKSVRNNITKNCTGNFEKYDGASASEKMDSCRKFMGENLCGQWY